MMWRRVGVVLAVGLLAAAVVFAARGIDWTALLATQSSPAWLLGLAGLVGVNLLAGGWLFWAVTRSFDARPTFPGVGPGRMVELIALSSLLNYVPIVRPGLVGRTAYLRIRHGLSLRRQAAVLAVMMGLAVTVSALTLLVLIRGVLGWTAFGLLAGLLTLGVALVSPRWTGRQEASPWLWVPLRTLDQLAAGGRLWLAFIAIGQPIGFKEAMLAAAGGVLVKLVGLTPNGLGLSEWAVAGLTALMTPVSAAAAAAAALVDRAVEIAVVAAAGLWAAWRLRGELPPSTTSAAGTPDHPA